jgi:hypothetical protein
MYETFDFPAWDDRIALIQTACFIAHRPGRPVLRKGTSAIDNMRMYKRLEGLLAVVIYIIADG